MLLVLGAFGVSLETDQNIRPTTPYPLLRVYTLVVFFLV